MVEFDVDLEYLKHVEELDYVVLHDENGVVDDMTFVLVDNDDIYENDKYEA